METINDRMEQIVNERFDGNKSAFAKAIGIPRGMISSYVGGNRKKSKPGVDLIVKIVKSLGVDSYWLLTGKGAPAADSGTVSGIRYNGSNNNTNNTTTNNYHVTGGGDKAASPEGVAAEVDSLRETVDMMKKLLAEKERVIRTQEVTISVLSERNKQQS